MWQMVFAHISIKGWIICSYVHGFFYCSLKVHQFTSEESSEDGSMPFLDMLILPQEDGSFHTTIYRKPTHTDIVSTVG